MHLHKLPNKCQVQYLFILRERPINTAHRTDICWIRIHLYLNKTLICGDTTFCQLCLVETCQHYHRELQKSHRTDNLGNLYLQNMLYSIRKIFSLTEIVNGRMSVYVARYVRHHIFQTKHKPKRRPTKAKNKYV